MDELTFERNLRDRPPADPHYRPRLVAEPGVVAAASPSSTSAEDKARPMMTAVRLATVATVVVLIGGLLLAGVLTQPSDERLPAVGASPSADASTLPDLLPGVDLVTEEVEPGVFRVDSDGIRPLSRPMGTSRPAYDIHNGMEGGIAAGLDGSVWWFAQDGFLRVGEPEVHAWPDDRQDTYHYQDGFNPNSLNIDLEVGPDGTVWLARHSLDAVRSDDDTSVWEDEISSFDGESWSVHQQDGEIVGVEVLRSGEVWGAWLDHVPEYPWSYVTVARLGATGWEPLPEVPGDRGDLSVAEAGAGRVWLLPGGEWRLQGYGESGWEEQTTPDAGGEMAADVAPNGTLWVGLSRDCGPGTPGNTGDGYCRGGFDMLARFDGTDWEVFDAEDGIPPAGHHTARFWGFLKAAPDGSVWFDPTVRDEELVDTDCDGVANFDGEAVTRYLRGMCVYAMDVATDDAVWLQAGYPGDDDPQPIHTYVITPRAVATGISSPRTSKTAAEDDDSVKPIQLPRDISSEVETGTLDTPFGPARWVHLTGDEVSLPSDLLSLVSTPAGYVAVSSGGPSDGSRSTTQSWRSPDLIEWTAEPLDFADGFGELWRTGDTYWLSAGESGLRRPALWRSQDTESWAQVSLGELDPPGPKGFAWVARPGTPASHDEVTIVPLTWTTDFDVVVRELPGGADLQWPALTEVAPGLFEVRQIVSFPRGELSADTFATLRMEDTELGLRVTDDANGTELTVLEGVSLEFIERLAVEEGTPMGSHVVDPVAGLAIVDDGALHPVDLPFEVANEYSVAVTADADGLALYAIGLDGLAHVHRTADGRTWRETDIIGDDADEPSGFDGVWTWLGPVGDQAVILSSVKGEWRAADGRLWRPPAEDRDGYRIANGLIIGPESEGDHRITFVPDEGERVSFDLSHLAMGRGACGSSEGLISPNTMATIWDCPGRREAWIITLDDMPASGLTIE